MCVAGLKLESPEVDRRFQVSPAGRRSLEGGPYAVPSDGTVHLTTQQAEQAERLNGDSLVPHGLQLAAGSQLNVEVAATRCGGIVASRLSFRRPTTVSIHDGTQVLLNLTLGGQASYRSDGGVAILTRSQEGIVFGTDEPLEIHGSARCELLSIVAPKRAVEQRLKHLVGGVLDCPLRFDAGLSADMLRIASPAFQLLLGEIDNAHGFASRSRIARHIEGLIIDALLLAQSHNHTGQLHQDLAAGPSSPITRAAALMRKRPDEPWSVAALAQSVHLSVRALQYGFERDFNTTPMAYLRTLRLHNAREALLMSPAGSTRVREIAISCGFKHMSRFAAAYRAAYGEPPSTTLERPLASGRPVQAKNNAAPADAGPTGGVEVSTTSLRRIGPTRLQAHAERSAHGRPR